MMRPTLVAAAVAAIASGLAACGQEVPETPAAPAPEMPVAPPADGMDAVPPADGSMPDTPPVNPETPAAMPDATSPATSDGTPVNP